MHVDVGNMLILVVLSTSYRLELFILQTLQMSAYHCILTFGSKYHESILSHSEFPQLWVLIYALTLNGNCAPLAIYACATRRTKTPQTKDMEAPKPKFIRSALSDDIWHLALALGSVSGASNSQQAMWESSHQQVSVKSAAGSRPRCLQLFPLSPSLLRPSPYWQSVNLHVFWTEVWVAPLSRGP